MSAFQEEFTPFSMTRSIGIPPQSVPRTKQLSSQVHPQKTQFVLQPGQPVVLYDSMHTASCGTSALIISPEVAEQRKRDKITRATKESCSTTSITVSITCTIRPSHVVCSCAENKLKRGTTTDGPLWSQIRFPPHPGGISFPF